MSNFELSFRRDEAEYFSRRAEEASELAATAGDDVGRTTHERFAAAFAERAIEAKLAAFMAGDHIG